MHTAVYVNTVLIVPSQIKNVITSTVLYGTFVKVYRKTHSYTLHSSICCVPVPQ